MWGKERGYCLMIGGEDAVVRHLDPIFKTLAPGVADGREPPVATGAPRAAEQGYLHCGPNGAGHFVKMVHNGIEYGLMAAYAEGFNILRHAKSGREAGGRCRDDAATPPGELSLHDRHREGGGGLAARQRGRHRGCST